MVNFMTTAQKSAVRADEAFESYYAMGGKRSLQKLSDALGIPLPTLKLWSKKHNWAESIRAREGKVRQAVEEKVVKSEVNERLAPFNLARNTLEGVIKKYADASKKLEVSGEELTTQARHETYFKNLERILKMLAMIDEVEKSGNTGKEENREILIRWLTNERTD